MKIGLEAIEDKPTFGFEYNETVFVHLEPSSMPF